MPNFQIKDENITVILDKSAADFPAELLRVKRLPGRQYDGVGAWVVPILPGLAAALLAVYGEEAGGELAALIEEKEKKFMEALEVKKQIDIWNMPAVEAINIAMTHKLFTRYGGDRGRYNRVYYPLQFGE